MTHAEAANAVAAWVRAVEPSITVERTYTFPVDIRQAAPPNIVAVTNRVFLADSDPRFGQRRVAQRRLRIFEMGGSVGIEPGTTDESFRNRHEELERIGNLLEKDISTGDGTLRGNLPAGVTVARTAAFDYSAAFLELDDGSRFRIVGFEIALAEAVGA